MASLLIGRLHHRGDFEMSLTLLPRKPSEPVSLHVGCMNFGKRTPEADARRIVVRALERGLSFFDTANAYNGGDSERVLGKALGADRDRCAIATKVGFGRIDGRPEGLRPERVLRSIDESLERLGTSWVDVYYLHVPDRSVPIEETLGAMKQVLASGKAKRWGVSNYASWEILEMMTLADRTGMARPAISQQMYNVLVRQLDVEYFKFTARYPIHTTIYNPLAGGLLVGKHKLDGSTLRGSRFEKNALYQSRYWSEPFFKALDDLRVIADSCGLSMTDLAYAWVASRPGVDSILIGPASVQHLDAAIDGSHLALSAEALVRVDAVHKAMTGTDASYAR
jgi:aryl-alcohol dehydrogenase-like predicted oxidoreductase